MVYTVESHNLTGDTTMGIANSLMSLVIPDTGGEGAVEEPTDGETSTEVPCDGIFVSAIGAPSTVASGEIASIGLEGSGDVYLVASDGYFLGVRRNRRCGFGRQRRRLASSVLRQRSDM